MGGVCFPFFPLIFRWYLGRVRVKDGRGEAEVSQWTLGRGGRRGTQGTFPHTSWDGSEGVEQESYANLRYICHREAFFPRQLERDFDTPVTVYRQRGGWQGRR